MALPLFITQERDFGLMQTAWSEKLNPVIAQPFNSGLMVQLLDPVANQLTTKISLTVGANIINHKLGRKLVGWIIVRQRSAATFFDTQDANKTPDKTLQLTASAPCVVDIFVF